MLHQQKPYVVLGHGANEFILHGNVQKNNATQSCCGDNGVSVCVVEHCCDADVMTGAGNGAWHYEDDVSIVLHLVTMLSILHLSKIEFELLLCTNCWPCYI